MTILATINAKGLGDRTKFSHLLTFLRLWKVDIGVITESHLPPERTERLIRMYPGIQITTNSPHSNAGGESMVFGSTTDTDMGEATGEEYP